jgi:hypothetical protein
LNRGARIRTGDLLLPKQALYQAKLRPVAGKLITLEGFDEPRQGAAPVADRVLLPR